MKFLIDVPKGNTDCNKCPFIINKFVCKYCKENKYCEQFDFSKLHIEEV